MMRDIRLASQEEQDEEDEVSPYQALGVNRSANGFLPDKMPEEEKKVVDDFFVSGGESLLSKVSFKSQPNFNRWEAC